MNVLTIPYKYEPRSWQLEFLESPARFKMCVWHRKSGKSMTALNEQIRKALTLKGSYYYFLPTYRQAKAVIWDFLVKEHVPKEVVDKMNDTDLSIHYKNGSIQRFAGCEDIDKHRGINPIDVVFDEWAEIKEEMWTVIIQPVLRQNGGTCTFIFTPKGRNHAWAMLSRAKENPEWFWSIKSVHDTNCIDPEELEEVKKDTPQAFYQQEYECEFTEGAGGFFRRIEENVWHGEMEPNPLHSYQIGADLAKYQDWTVLTPFDLTTFKVGKQTRFNQIDWNLQKARIEALARRYNSGIIVVDSTGLGDPIAEDLERMGLSVVPYKFTERSKRQLLDNLAILLEQDKIKIPDDEGLKDELHAMTFTIGERGKAKVQAPSGMTDDRVMSLALAVWEAKNPISRNQGEYKLYNSDYI